MVIYILLYLICGLLLNWFMLVASRTENANFEFTVKDQLYTIALWPVWAVICVRFLFFDFD